MVVADMNFFVVAFFSSLKSDAKSSMESEEEKRRVRGMRREEMIRNNLKESRKMNGLGGRKRDVRPDRRPTLEV